MTRTSNHDEYTQKIRKGYSDMLCSPSSKPVYTGVDERPTEEEMDSPCSRVSSSCSESTNEDNCLMSPENLDDSSTSFKDDDYMLRQSLDAMIENTAEEIDADLSIFSQSASDGASELISLKKHRLIPFSKQQSDDGMRDELRKLRKVSSDLRRTLADAQLCPIIPEGEQKVTTSDLPVEFLEEEEEGSFWSSFIDEMNGMCCNGCSNL
uniref:Uncharacterized protein n=1 Tax=Attheya septentrionalis TaxID=420275 RepID=A0A7S2UE77_9STRA|mmetsp:Transcript_21792/g.39373  ORF Transcript_21792/g.39373 Transcript_21792/m.39373 type:complete len:209 (+) Transcript_21792:203-829(+)|eukprot:CAMPEP_0198289938 /NCGR_PEP_ID=MMETSP1449-20131203/7961_1 /TAXON_ID=420275 /ORGANISM="Attheya septentrionalis, Strain CCMP2084" /LENGTH=208 /DNA_ID=CAMNT_0043988343 /DNA_START=117 /DNA_END=743 /DNA_ORIENTATION=-